MDALPGIGHACGHNLIAISGEHHAQSHIITSSKYFKALPWPVRLRQLFRNLISPGRLFCWARLVRSDGLDFDIVLKLLLPAEEGGSGKVILLEKGAYKDMDACLM